jgi:hypothetical protein
MALSASVDQLADDLRTAVSRVEPRRERRDEEDAETAGRFVGSGVHRR